MKTLLAALTLALVVAFSPAAWAGSYLDRAALLLDEARKEGDMLMPHTNDKELAFVVHELAVARVRAARKMEVPLAVGKAHPHLLLVLENLERAADAAVEGSFKKFMEHLGAARDEDKIFRTIVAELGWSLPDLCAKK
jgi:hypothetical protein